MGCGQSLNKIFILSLLINTTFGKPFRTKVRILNHSTKRDVVLINKGSEDGIKKEMNALFYNHDKKIFRAELLHLSYSRSIWQIYRNFDKDLVRKEYSLILTEVSKVEVVPDPGQK